MVNSGPHLPWSNFLCRGKIANDRWVYALDDPVNDNSTFAFLVMSREQIRRDINLTHKFRTTLASRPDIDNDAVVVAENTEREKAKRIQNTIVSLSFALGPESSFRFASGHVSHKLEFFDTLVDITLAIIIGSTKCTVEFSEDCTTFDIYADYSPSLRKTFNTDLEGLLEFQKFSESGLAEITGEGSLDEI